MFIKVKYFLFLFLVLITSTSLHAVAATDVSANAVVCAPSSDNINAGDLNIFHSVSPPAHKIREIAWLVLGICAAIFVVVVF